MTYLLMFSGGVDSVIALKWLVDKGIIPILVHIRTKKLTNRMEEKIKRNAKKISPQSPYYIFESKTQNYNVRMYGPNLFGPARVYGINLGGKNVFYPEEYADIICVGTRKKDHVAQEHFYDYCQLYEIPFEFPVWDVNTWKEFKKLPRRIQRNVVTSTRPWIREHIGCGEWVKGRLAPNDGRKRKRKK